MLLRWFIVGVAFLLATTTMCLPQAQPAQNLPGTISANLKDVPVADFLHLLQQASGLSMVVAPNVRGSVTAVFQDTPVEQALEAVLKANQLVGEREGSVVTIMTMEDAARRAEQRLRLAESRLMTAPVTTCTYRLSYAHAPEVVPLLQPLLSSRGRIAADLRNNMLIVTDIPQVLEEIGLFSDSSDRGHCF